MLQNSSGYAFSTTANVVLDIQVGEYTLHDLTAGAVYLQYSDNATQKEAATYRIQGYFD